MSAPITCLAIRDVSDLVKAAGLSEHPSPVMASVEAFKALDAMETPRSDDELKVYFETALAISTHGFNQQEELPAKATGVFAELIQSKGIEFFRPPPPAEE